MSYPNLYRSVAHSDTIVFYDVEATQFSKKLISFGMVVIKKKRDSFEMEKVDEFFTLIKQDENVEIGHYVEELTGIHKSDLEKGMPVVKFVEELNRRLENYSRICFISYGDLDKTVLKSTIQDVNSFIYRKDTRFFDFHSYLKKNLANEKGGTYSISSLISLFGLNENDYAFHNPLADSKALFDIFSYYVNNEDKIKKIITKTYDRNPYLKKALLKNPNMEVIYKNL